MLILAIDTAIDGCSVAILKDDQVLGEQHVEQSGMLFSLVEELLKQQGVGYQDLEAIAVTRGPGSFTGLRLGLAAAQGWCLAGKLPLWGVPTLDCLAYQAGGSKKPLIAAISTKRNDFYVSRYTAGTFFGDSPQIMTMEDLINHTDAYGVIAWAEPDHPIHHEPGIEKVHLKAASVGQLALYAQHHNSNIFSGEPLYLRPAKVYEGTHAIHH